VAAGIDAAGEAMELRVVDRYAFSALAELADKALRRRAPKLSMAEYRRRRASGTAAPVPGLDGLLELLDHPREHYLKLGSALAAALSKLTAGRLRRALSGTGFSWDRLMAEGGAAVLELPFLRGSDTARSVARLALVDLQHAIGRRPPGGRRLSLFIDEFSDLAMPEFVEVLNKARSMGVSVTVATQTFSDLRASLGSEARAMQILGNAGTIVQFRTHDETDAELFSKLAGREPARVVSRSHSFEPALFASGSKWVDDYRATFTTHTQLRDEEVVPPYLLHQLPNLHAFARVGGQLYKLMVPVIEGGAPCGSS
jgi:conjugal transfer pilus assembly protein TraD